MAELSVPDWMVGPTTHDLQHHSENIVIYSEASRDVRSVRRWAEEGVSSLILAQTLPWFALLFRMMR